MIHFCTFLSFNFCAVVFPGGTGQPIDFFVGDVTSYTLHNLQPGTTYDLKVVAQYTGGMSAPLPGQGTTRTCSNCVKRVLQCVRVASSCTDSFLIFMLLLRFRDLHLMFLPLKYSEVKRNFICGRAELRL